MNNVIENEKNEWQRFIISFNSPFFPIFQSVIKKVSNGQNEVIIAVQNKQKSDNLKMIVKEKFKFIFDWQDDFVCGIEVYKNVGLEYV